MATMKDVAREANVALGTVSKYINNKPIGDSYKIRIEEAIEKLNYQVNTYARGLKTQSTKTIALIIPDIRNPFFSSFAYHVETALFKYGYKMFVCSSNEAPSAIVDYINMARQNKADGIIAITYSDIDNIVTEDIPFISVDRHFSANIPCVAADNHTGGILAADKLAECGCRRPLFLRTGSSIFGETNKRKDGFLFGCKKHGLDSDVIIIDDVEGKWKTIFRETISYHLENNLPLFDGIFAITDQTAYQAIHVLDEFNLKVPEDVQVIGFDGIQVFNNPEEAYYVSTFRQPVEKIAKCCVDYLLNGKHEEIPSVTLFPVEYQFGNTTLQ